MQIAVAASGNLGHGALENLLLGGYEVNCIFTNRASGAILQLAEDYGVPSFVGNPRNGEAFHWVSERDIKCDVLLSVNYLYIFEADLINWPNKIALNVHGSLLPKYRGRTPHVWAIINGEKETGVTVHEMVERLDGGDIILQRSLPITNSKTGAEILHDFHTIYPKAILSALEQVAVGNAQKYHQDEGKATYFGKRQPSDGLVIWDWQWQRIHNWVRAQAYPYPGAFTYYNNKKVIIDEVEPTDVGFDYETPNGTILVGGAKPIVKTPNMAVRLSSLREPNLLFRTNEKLQ